MQQQQQTWMNGMARYKGAHYVREYRVALVNFQSLYLVILFCFVLFSFSFCSFALCILCSDLKMLSKYWIEINKKNNNIILHFIAGNDLESRSTGCVQSQYAQSNMVKCCESNGFYLLNRNHKTKMFSFAEMLLYAINMNNFENLKRSFAPQLQKQKLVWDERTV